jgi:nicotinamidase-related amidase
MDDGNAVVALLLIDLQQGFDDSSWGRRNNPAAERNAARLLAAWRAGNRPLVHIQHRSTERGSPLRPGQPGVEFNPVVAPLDAEPIMAKTVNSAFIGTGLERYLRDHMVDRVVIVGLTTNHCVETTARMAGNLGFRPILVADATAAFDRRGPDGTTWPAETIHAISLANIHNEFGEIASTDEVLARFA